MSLHQSDIMTWQKFITTWAISKGFKWAPEQIDTMLLRIHSEVSEAGEAIRDSNKAEFAEELADIFIRLANTAEVMGVDLDKEVVKKMDKNQNRPYLHGRKMK